MKNIKTSIFLLACLGLYHSDLFCGHLYLSGVADLYYKEWSKVSAEIYDANYSYCTKQKDKNTLIFARHKHYNELKKCLLENINIDRTY